MTTAIDRVISQLPPNASPLQYARAYRALDINVLSIKADGSKRPAWDSLVNRTWKHLQERFMTDEELIRSFSNGNGLAAIGGRISGNLEDFDSALRKHHAGDKVPVVVKRGGEEIKLEVTLEPPR